MDVEYEGVARMRSDPEKWANSLILEEEQRRIGRMATTPLHHWILARGLIGQGSGGTRSRKKKKKRKR